MSTREPSSPCINICSLDEQGLCRGCLRSLSEIGGWIRMSPEQKWGVILATEARRLSRRAAPANCQQEIK